MPYQEVTEGCDEEHEGLEPKNLSAHIPSVFEILLPICFMLQESIKKSLTHHSNSTLFLPTPLLLAASNSVKVRHCNS